MAQVAETWADHVVVTSDNPRTEDPQRIIDNILTGFHEPSKVLVESDRRRGIHAALETAHDGDIVLIAGKGHETYQLIGDQRLDFSDRDVAQAYLKDRCPS